MSGVQENCGLNYKSPRTSNPNVLKCKHPKISSVMSAKPLAKTRAWIFLLESYPKINFRFKEHFLGIPSGRAPSWFQLGHELLGGQCVKSIKRRCDSVTESCWVGNSSEHKILTLPPPCWGGDEEWGLTRRSLYKQNTLLFEKETAKLQNFYTSVLFITMPKVFNGLQFLSPLSWNAWNCQLCR